MGAVIELKAKDETAKPTCAGRFAAVPIALIEDPRVKHATFRFWVGLASFARPDGKCWPGLDKLRARVRMSRQTIAGHLKILQDLGLLRVVPDGRPDGKPGFYYQLVVGKSDNVDLPETPTQVVGNSDKSLSETPTNPSHSPIRINTPEEEHTSEHTNALDARGRGRADDLFSGVEVQAEELPHEGKEARAPTSQPTPRKPKPVGGARATELEREFDVLWLAFPSTRRIARDKALAAYCKARTKATAEEILEGVRRYAESDEVARGFACNPTKWLTEERWTLHPEPAGQRQISNHRGNKPTALEIALAEVSRL
jgi:hypothetical protein